MKSAQAIKKLKAVGFNIVRRGRGSHVIMERGKGLNTERIVINHPAELSEGIAGKVRGILTKEEKKNMCKNGVCDLNMFDFCRCP